MSLRRYSASPIIHNGASLLRSPYNPDAPPPPASPPPPPTPETPDKITTAHVIAADAAAAAAWKIALTIAPWGGISPLVPIRQAAAHYADKRHRARSLPEIFHVATESYAVAEAFRHLHPRHVQALRNDGYTLPPAAAVADALDSLPVLAAYHADFKATCAAAQAMQDAINANRAAEAAKQAPGLLLTRLRADGVALATDEAGNLLAQAGAVVSPKDREALATHRVALVALLQAEQQAAAPVVLVAGPSTPREQAQALVTALRRRGITISETFDHDTRVTRIVASPAGCALSDDERAQLLALKDDVLDVACGADVIG